MSSPMYYGENFYRHVNADTNPSEGNQAPSTVVEQGQPSRLGNFFVQDAVSPTRFTDHDISEISTLLQSCGQQTWSDVPRFYIVLRKIGQLQLLDSLIDQGVTDYWFPFDQRSVPQLITGTARTDFIIAQESILTTAVDLEKSSTNKHHHFKGQETLPFEVREILGRGAVSRVDKVFSPFSRREYARKLFRRSNGPSKTDVQAFMNELRILKRVRHQHCTELVASYTDARYLGIIMSPVADCNLHTFYTKVIEHPEISATLRSFFGCLSSAIHYLHSTKIRHRDIKPENILVKGQNIYLADFGISLDWENLSKSTTVNDSGKTPAYCAPEVANHEKRNSSSDIWSLGCVFLEMCTILKGRNVSKMRQHFKTQSDVWVFHRNLPAIEQWIEGLKNCGSKVDDHPLDWIKAMLQPVADLRPLAQDLCKWTTGTNLLSENGPKPFCADCCITSGGEDSDVSYVSDGDFWAENSDEENSTPALTSDVIKPAGSGSSNAQQAFSLDKDLSIDTRSEVEGLAKTYQISSPGLDADDVMSQESVDLSPQASGTTQSYFSTDSLSKALPSWEGGSGVAALTPPLLSAKRSPDLTAESWPLNPAPQKQPYGETASAVGPDKATKSTETPANESLVPKLDAEQPPASQLTSKDLVESESKSIESAQESRHQHATLRTEDSGPIRPTETMEKVTDNSLEAEPKSDKALIDISEPENTIPTNERFLGPPPKLSLSDWQSPSAMVQAMCRDTKFTEALLRFDSRLYQALQDSQSTSLNQVLCLLIDNGLTINDKRYIDKDDRGPLYNVLRWASDETFRPLFSRMIRMGADLRLGGKAGDVTTVFFQSAWQGSLWAVTNLVTADARKPREWQCRLMRGASQGGQLEIVEYLHNSHIFKASEMCGDCGFAALDGASYNGQEAIVKYLLESFGDLTHIDNKWGGTTSLYDASRGGYAGIVRLLLEHGAKADPGTLSAASGYGHAQVLERVGANELGIKKRSDYKTPLYSACGGNHIKVARLVLAHGADVETKDSGSFTPSTYMYVPNLVRSN